MTTGGKMAKTINHLIQLQELALARAEQEASLRRDRLAELDESISRLTTELTGDVRGTFEKLRKRDPVAIVPVADGNCAGCGLKIPISLVQAVRAAELVQHCPNCTRILYYAESRPRTMRQRTSRTEPQKVGIARFSSPSLMIPRLEAETRDGVILEMARKMQQEGFVDDAEKLAEAALQREAIISTVVDHGLAFPHVRAIEGGGLTLTLGLAAKGMTFDENAPLKTKIVFFLVIPSAVSAFYLKLLAGLTETFMDAEARKLLLAQKDAPSLWKTLVKLTRPTIP